MDILKLVGQKVHETYDMHKKHGNRQFVRVLEVLGFDRNYVSGKGAYLVDDQGREVLDFLAGFGVFNVGRNHPEVVRAVRDILGADPASMVQMDLGAVSGVLAERLALVCPGDLDAVFFTNSGAEGVEGALKFARQATGRERIIHCEKGFHGQTLGALSVNGNQEFRSRNEPLLPGCTPVPFNDLEALELELARGGVAGFIVEPVQGKGVHIPDAGYLPGAKELCAAHGALFIADEVQTGLGRTGAMFAVDHYGVVPDIMILSKALSGGVVPVGAIVTTREIHDRVFDSMERCFAHSNTFGMNDAAMAAGLAALEVIESHGLAENARVRGGELAAGLEELSGRYEMLAEVRQMGLMIGMQFREPSSMALRAGWKLLHKMNKDLFCQMITVPLLSEHDILTQVAGHGLDTVKILPPLTIGEREVDKFLTAMDKVLEAAHRIPGSAWTTVKNLGLRTAKTA